MNLPVYNSFFVGKDPAIITFNIRKNTNGNSEHYTLVNATDIIEKEESVEKYTAKERKAFVAFQSDTNHIDSSYLINQRLVKNWSNKKLDFIRLHKDDYFSFWLFRREIAPNFFMNSDSLLHFYKTVFSISLRNSNEGKEIMKILYGRKLASSENMQAPDFTATDIHGKKFEIKEL